MSAQPYRISAKEPEPVVKTFKRNWLWRIVRRAWFAILLWSTHQLSGNSAWRAMSRRYDEAYKKQHGHYPYYGGPDV